jgi:hypothetical protein
MQQTRLRPAAAPPPSPQHTCSSSSFTGSCFTCPAPGESSRLVLYHTKQHVTGQLQEQHHNHNTPTSTGSSSLLTNALLYHTIHRLQITPPG